MMSRLAAAFALLPVAALAIEVPSGQQVALREVLVEQQGTQTYVRFQFLAPQIARDAGLIDFSAVEPDLEYLCASVALQYLQQYALAGDVVVVTLQDRAVAFGDSDPDATQYFDAFAVRDGTCIWEGM